MGGRDVHGQTIAHPLAHLADLTGEVERPASLVGAVEALQSPTELPGCHLGLKVPDRVVERFLEQNGLVRAGHRPLGEGTAPASGDCDRSLIALRKLDRNLVIVFPAVALPTD